MRTAILWLLFCLCQAASMAAPEEQHHEFKVTDLARGGHSGLKLQTVANYDVAHFQGRAKVTGTFVAEWTIGDDEVKPTEKSYTFVLSENAARSLPHWRDYIARVIYIDNGERALEMFAGREVAQQFQRHLTSKVSVDGTLTFAQLRVWVECDSANARAVAVGAGHVGAPRLETLVASLGCSGPYDLEG